MSVLETVLRCDTERSDLLQEEARLLALMNPAEPQQNGTAEKSADDSKKKSGGKANAAAPISDPEASTKLEKVRAKMLRPGLTPKACLLSLPNLQAQCYHS